MAEAADFTVEATVEAPEETILERALKEVGIKPTPALPLMLRPAFLLPPPPCSGFWPSFLISKLIKAHQSPLQNQKNTVTLIFLRTSHVVRQYQIKEKNII